eukprot:72264-Prymnesium_polylepis.1
MSLDRAAAAEDEVAAAAGGLDEGELPNAEDSGSEAYSVHDMSAYVDELQSPGSATMEAELLLAMEDLP